MSENDLIRKAMAFAAEAHQGQFRRDGKTPYFNHCVAVADRVRSESSSVVATAFLHDVCEDCGLDVGDLRRIGFPEDVVTAVQLLTRDEGTDYVVYLHRIRLNPIARKVKIADMLSNLADEPTEKQIRKYAQGLLELTA